MNGWETARFGDPDVQQDRDRNWLPRERREEDPDDLRDHERDMAWERRDREHEKTLDRLGATPRERALLAMTDVVCAMIIGPPEPTRRFCAECGDPAEMLTDAGHCGPCEVEIARDALPGYKADAVADDLRQQGFEIE